MFSGAVRLTDLNDYIAPSQSCVVTLNAAKKQDESQTASGEVALQPRAPSQKLNQFSTPTFQHPAGAQPPGTSAPNEGDAVKITLHDCLACSGCVTSAETLLLEQQSISDFTDALSKQGRCVVVSLSPQSVAALAALYGMNPLEAWQRLATWLRSLGVAYVADINAARDLALLENAAELINRIRACRQVASSAGINPTSASLQISGMMTHAVQLEHTQTDLSHNNAQDMQTDTQTLQASCSDHHQQQQPVLPLLASSCPGWVCYAEKTQGSIVLPHMSTTKSPQAVMGTLVKRLLPAKIGINPADIFHVTVMPCYDKKLEAAREELTLPDGKVPEVDCCLTTVEIHQLLSQQGVDHLSQVNLGQLHTAPHAPHDLQAHTAHAQDSDDMDVDETPQCQAPTHALNTLVGGQAGFPNCENGNAHTAGLPASTSALDVLWRTWQQGLPASLFGLPGSSGGYTDFVFRVAAAELFGVEVPPGPLPFKQLRNADFQEVELHDNTGRVLLRCAIANGFRNIQTLMRQIKFKKCTYDYVEVMACPSGCLNGGGQIRPSKDQSAAQVLQAAEAAYHHPAVVPRQPAANPAVRELYSTWMTGPPGSAAAQQLLHTTFKTRSGTAAPGLKVASDW